MSQCEYQCIRKKDGSHDDACPANQSMTALIKPREPWKLPRNSRREALEFLRDRLANKEVSMAAYRIIDEEIAKYPQCDEVLAACEMRELLDWAYEELSNCTLYDDEDRTAQALAQSKLKRMREILTRIQSAEAERAKGGV